MTDNVVLRHMDFTLSAEPITFTIAPDVFTCTVEVPLDALTELAKIASTQQDNSERMERMKQFFDTVMDFDSAAKFRSRCKVATQEAPNPYPIGMRHVIKIVPWLMEVYGLRPTQESSESSDGSTLTDTSSTDGASPEESTI